METAALDKPAAPLIDQATFQSLAENLPECCWIANGDGYIIWYNQRWYEFSGTTPEQMEGWGWQSVHDPAHLPAVMQRWTLSIATGEPFEMTFPVRGADGLFRPFLTRVRPVRDDAGEVVHWFGVNTEISGQRAIEEALRKASSRAKAAATEQAAILAQLAEGVIVTDDRGRIVFVNDAARRLHDVDLLGVTLDEYSQSHHLTAAGGRPGRSAGLQLARAAAGATITDARWHLRRSDGSEILVIGSAKPVRHADGTIVGAVLTVRDDTERQAAEQALVDLAATLELRIAERDRVWRNSQELLVIVDAEGVFRAANEAWTRILGWQPDEVVGRTRADFIHPDDHASSVAMHEVAKNENVSRFESRYRHRDGSYRWVSWNVSPESGLVYGSGRDITAEKEAAETLAQTEEQLRQSQKMEAIGQLTGGIAHDFNNLLQGISGSLELILARIEQGRGAECGRYAEVAMASANRAAALTHRLLAFSRRQTLEPRPIDLNQLIDGMTELFGRTVGPSIQLQTRLADAPWTTGCDPNQLENAVLNLVINARDAMPAGGRLVIETANSVIPERRRAFGHGPPAKVPPGAYVALSVTDTGAGMAPGVLARVFEPFYTTKPLGQGTGLGLSMIHGFVQQSGGHLDIRSEVGQGTCVTIYLARDLGAEVLATEIIGGVPVEAAADASAGRPGATIAAALLPS